MRIKMGAHHRCACESFTPLGQPGGVLFLGSTTRRSPVYGVATERRSPSLPRSVIAEPRPPPADRRPGLLRFRPPPRIEITISLDAALSGAVPCSELGQSALTVAEQLVPEVPGPARRIGAAEPSQPDIGSDY